MYCEKCGKEFNSDSVKRAFEDIVSGYTLSDNKKAPNKRIYHKEKWVRYCPACHEKRLRMLKRKVFWFKVKMGILLIVCLSIGFCTYKVYKIGSTDSSAKNKQKDIISENNSSLSENIDVKSQSISTPKTIDKIWSEQNLDVTTYRNGEPILHAQTEEEWKNANENKIGAWCYYDNDSDKGILYNKYAVNDNRGLAPSGWHIPSITEWNNLINLNFYSFLTNCKGGMRKSNGGFKKLNKVAYFWASIMDGENKNIAFDLDDHDITREGNRISNTGEGFSVRCVKN